MPTRSRDYGEGTISARGDHTWRIRWMAKDPVTRRSVQKSATVHGTERDARRALTAKRDEEFNPTDMTVTALCQHWLDLPATRLTTRTRQGRQTIIDKHITPNVGSTKARLVTPAQLTAFYASMAARGYSEQSIRHVHNVLNPAYKLALDMEWLTKNPCSTARVPKVHAPPVVPPRTADVLAAIAACEPELRCFAMLAAITGARRGELCGLQWGDVNWERRVLRLARSISEPTGGLEVKPTKSGRPRQVSFDDAGQAVLREQYTRHLAYGYLGRESDYVFASPSCVEGDLPARPHRFTQAWREVCKQVGVHVRFHDLRHWHASVLIADGHDIKSVSDRLGHAKASTTLDIYSHLLEDRGTVLAETASRALTPGA